MFLKVIMTTPISLPCCQIDSQNPDERFKYVLERLVVHLHDFARETRLSTQEWMAGINFLTKTGQMCSDVRQVCTFRTPPNSLSPTRIIALTRIQEFILLSDILGLSLLVDSIDHPKPPSSTEGTVLGPL